MAIQFSPTPIRYGGHELLALKLEQLELMQARCADVSSQYKNLFVRHERCKYVLAMILDSYFAAMPTASCELHWCCRLDLEAMKQQFNTSVAATVELVHLEHLKSELHASKGHVAKLQSQAPPPPTHTHTHTHASYARTQRARITTTPSLIRHAPSPHTSAHMCAAGPSSVVLSLQPACDQH